MVLFESSFHELEKFSYRQMTSVLPGYLILLFDQFFIFAIRLVSRNFVETAGRTWTFLSAMLALVCYPIFIGSLVFLETVLPFFNLIRQVLCMSKLIYIVSVPDKRPRSRDKNRRLRFNRVFVLGRLCLFCSYILFTKQKFLKYFWARSLIHSPPELLSSKASATIYMWVLSAMHQ